MHSSSAKGIKNRQSMESLQCSALRGAMAVLTGHIENCVPLQ